MIKSIFPTLIYLKQLDGTEQTIELDLAVEDQLKSLNQTWPEGVVTSFTFENSQGCFLTKYELDEFKLTLLGHVNEYLGQIYSTKKYKVELTNSFLNLIRKGGFQFSHHHPFSTISGVYYYQATEADASITFENPNSLADYVDPAGELLENSATFMPKSCRLLLFPAWLKHRVNMQSTDADRIAIAFNFTVEPIKE